MSQILQKSVNFVETSHMKKVGFLDQSVVLAIGLCCKAAGMVVHHGDLVLGYEVTQAMAGGCRANNVR